MKIKKDITAQWMETCPYYDSSQVTITVDVSSILCELRRFDLYVVTNLEIVREHKMTKEPEHFYYEYTNIFRNVTDQSLSFAVTVVGNSKSFITMECSSIAYYLCKSSEGK